MGAHEDMMAGTENLSSEPDKGFLGNAWDDVVYVLDNFYKGAVQGAQEIVRQGNNLAESNPLALSGTPMQEGVTNAPAPEQTEQQQQDLSQYGKAVDTFGQETVKAPLGVAGLVNPFVAAAYVPFLANDVKKSYEKGSSPQVDADMNEIPGSGSVLKGIGQAARDLTYGPVVDFATQPNLAQQFHNKPVSTAGNAVMSVLPMALMARSLYDKVTSIPQCNERGVPLPDAEAIKAQIHNDFMNYKEPVDVEAIKAQIHDDFMNYKEPVKEIKPPTAPIETPPEIKGSDIIAAGEKQLGKPYELGADGVNATDCGKFTQDVLAETGVNLDYRTADGQYRQLETEGKVFTSEADAQVGDLVFFDVPSNRAKWKPSGDPNAVNMDGEAYKGVTHVGIYAGEGKVLQAGSHGVSYADINDFGNIVGFGKTAKGEVLKDTSALGRVEKQLADDTVDSDLANIEGKAREAWQMTGEEYLKDKEKAYTAPEIDAPNAADYLSMAHDAAEKSAYRQATILANKAGDKTWEQTYRNMADKMPEEHKLAVEQAIKGGKSVPKEVLADYPDLVKKYPDVMVKAEQAMREEVNQAIEPVVPSVGGSIKLTKNTPKTETQGIKFSDPAIEARWQEAAKGVQKESIIARIKESASSLRNKATRVYEDLPNIAEFSPLKFDLLKLEKQKGVVGDRTARLLQGITIKLDKPGMDLFTRKVVLDDLAQSKGELPFGFTAETLVKEIKAIDATVKANPEIARAIGKRKQVWDALKEDYSAAMKDIGFDVSDKINREDYFRHQVLEYANIRAITGTGQKLKTPTNRGFLKGREGSAKDINANYLQAEFEVMAQMLYDTELAKIIKVVDKNYSIRTKLFDEFGDQWRDNIPDGYTTWQPREGTSFYMANSIPESVAMKVLGGAMEEIGVTVDQLHQVLAKGSRFKELVVKQEVADTLNKVSTPPTESVLGKISRALVTPWKVWVLMSPTRAIKYNLRNVTGDADALFTMNKSAFKKVGQAEKELYQTIYGDRAMTPEMGEWFKRGGMETTSPIQELTDINGLRMFEKFADKDPNIIKNAWVGYWGKVRTATQFREAIFRYATYLDYLEQMKKSGGKPNNFGASIPEEVMALSDLRDRAFKLSNDVLGAYDNVSVLGKDIRTHLIPFWSWYETNFKRYIQFYKNQQVDGTLASAISRKLVGNVLIRSPYYAYATGAFVVKAGAMWAALQAYNNLVWSEEEKELPVEEQARPHIVLGRDANGKVKYFSRLGSFPDFLEWFGLDAPTKDINDYLDGSRSLKEIVTDWGKSPLNKLVQGISPLIKMPGELLTKEKLFPDAFKPRPIYDRGQYIADSFGLGNEFKAISKTELAKAAGISPRPAKPYMSQSMGENLLYYKADPGQSSYYNIINAKREYLETIGKGGTGDFNSPKTEVLRNYKLAIRLKDEESAAFYLAEYQRLGGTKAKLKKSLESMDPLAGLSKQDKKNFLNSLNGEQHQELEKANKYYKGVMLGK